MKSIISICYAVICLCLLAPLGVSANQTQNNHYRIAKQMAEQHKWTDAVRHYQLAEETGNRHAKVDLALYHLRGHGGLNRDPQLAVTILSEVAGQGDARAIRILSNLYRDDSHGVATDVTKSRLYQELSELYFAHRLPSLVYQG